MRYRSEYNIRVQEKDEYSELIPRLMLKPTVFNRSRTIFSPTLFPDAPPTPRLLRT